MTRRQKNRLDARADLAPDAADRIDTNIEGAVDFLEAIIADPDLVNHIPIGAEIILDHRDDPNLTQANRQLEAVAQRAGSATYTHRVGTRSSAISDRGKRTA